LPGEQPPRLLNRKLEEPTTAPEAMTPLIKALREDFRLRGDSADPGELSVSA
jgi:hypothetical protein